jgi:flavodoxin
MKDFLIVYSSKTGNTEKVAKKFYEVAGGAGSR